MADDRKRPGGELASRPLHFIFLADCSGSMTGQKINSLNTAIREAIPHMREVAKDNVNAEVLVRAIRFSSGAQWHLSQTTPVESFTWVDLTADGVTDMGKALSMVAEQMRIPPMPDRALPPVLVLVSDGQPTDDFNSGLQALLAQNWGRKAVRLAIAMGEDADHEVLEKFIGNPEIKPLQANNPESLIRHIKWASTTGIQASSAPPSQITGQANTGNVPIPQPADGGKSAGRDVW